MSPTSIKSRPTRTDQDQPSQLAALITSVRQTIKDYVNEHYWLKMFHIVQ